MIDLDRIEAALTVAPGPWRTGADWYAREVRDATGSGVAWVGGGTDREAHALAKALASLPALVAELRAARAEIERLRTAAADERADVVAWMEHAGEGGPHDAGDCTSCDLAASIRDGAHVGAAKGGERG